MPEATEYILDTRSQEYKDVDKAFVEEFNARNKRFARRWRYYDGNHDRPLKEQGDGLDDNVILNQIEPLVDKLTAFLIGDGVEFDAMQDAGMETNDDQEEETEEADQLDIAIADIWRASRGNVLLGNIATSGAVEGHCAVRLIPQDDGMVKISRISQHHFAAFWDAFDVERVLWYRLQHRNGGLGKRIDYVRGIEDGDAWNHDAPQWSEVVYVYAGKESVSPIESEGSGKWKRESITVLDFDFPPVVDWQNLSNPNGYYGKSDVDSAIRLNDALNFILSNMLRIIKHYADPKTIGTGFTMNDVVMSEVGGLYTVSSPEARVYNLEMQSDLQSSMRLAETIMQGLWQSGGMVDPQTMKDKIGALTNFGLRVLYLDAIKRIASKRELYEEGFEHINKYGLAMSGLPMPSEVKTLWVDVIPEDMDAKAERLMAEVGAGLLDKESYAEGMGYDWMQIEKRLRAQQPGPVDIGMLLESFGGGQTQ